MDIRVESKAAPFDELDPELIWFGGRRVPVLSIVDRWYGPHQRWWKVETEDGFYVLRRDDGTGEWELAAVTRA